LRKVTLNLYEKDVAFLQAAYPDYTVVIRNEVRRFIRAIRNERHERYVEGDDE